MYESFSDPYREYPLRSLGYTNAIIRPWKEFIPSQAYQASIGIMHTYFLTNCYDYVRRIDAKSPISSAIDCFTWHCCASWLGPAAVIDLARRIAKIYTSNRFLPIVCAYAAFGISAPIMDRVMNWYFYGFWGAGNKERPRLNLK